MSLRNPSTLVSLPTDDTFDYLFKVVLIGDCGTGKTCVVQRFKTGHYEERHGNTIGVDFSMKTITIDGKKIKVSNSAEHLANITIFIIFFYSIYLDSALGYGWTRKISNYNTKLLSLRQWRYHRLVHYHAIHIFIQIVELNVLILFFLTVSCLSI